MGQDKIISNITIIIVLYREDYNLLYKTLDKIRDFKKIIIDNSNNVESQDPEFVQNHAYVIAYNNKKDNQHWFRYNKHLT